MAELILLVLMGVFIWAVAKAASRQGGRHQTPRPSPAALGASAIANPGAPGATPRHAEGGPAAPAAGWVPKGQEVTVAGYRIPGGMIYVGRGLTAAGRGAGIEPALIDPRLPVDRREPDRMCSLMSYWPSYSGIPAASRAAYLEWLAGGREDPSFGVGHVFLFFYGLERRILLDAQHSDAARAEIPSIVAETQRLLGVYGSNRSFRGYAESFLSFVKAAQGQGDVYSDKPPMSILPGAEFPLMVRLALGQLAVGGKPIPAEWALVWFRSAPSTQLRTPAQRCPDELTALFRIRYGERFGAGIVVKPNKTTLRAAYKPASASFAGLVTLSFADTKRHEIIPDVTALKGPLTTIADLAEACVSDLEPYSRWVGRNPGLRTSPAAAALLPGDLVAHYRSDEVDALSKAIEYRLGTSSFAEIPFVDLIEHWSPSAGARFTRADGVLLAQLLEKRGYGVEPDPRFGGTTPSAERTGIVFRLPTGAPSAPSATYSAAAVTLQLAVAVAVADNHVSESELQVLYGHLIGSLPVTPQEHVRLEAYLRWLLVELPSPVGLRSRLEAFDETQRAQIGRLLVAVATADGQIDPLEVSALVRLFKLLGLDPADAYTELHAQSIDRMPVGSPPLAIRPADSLQPSFAIGPRPPTKGAGPIALDMQKVEARLAQSSAASALLSSIFTESEEAIPITQQAGVANVARLDEVHSGLLRELAGRPSWSRGEYDVLANKHGVLPDGALDLLNEVSLERSGELCLEGEDPLMVNPQAMKELAV